MNPCVYLSGPMTGLSYDGATQWRAEAAAGLGSAITALSPARNLGHLAAVEALDQAYTDNALTLPCGITTQDRWDAMRCDVLLVNVLGATKVSIGTVMEVAWADAARTPIVLVIEDAGNPHDHVMVAQVAGYRVTSLAHGIAIVRHLLA